MRSPGRTGCWAGGFRLPLSHTKNGLARWVLLLSVGTLEKMGQAPPSAMHQGAPKRGLSGGFHLKPQKRVSSKRQFLGCPCVHVWHLQSRLGSVSPMGAPQYMQALFRSKRNWSWTTASGEEVPVLGHRGWSGPKLLTCFCVFSVPPKRKKCVPCDFL